MKKKILAAVMAATMVFSLVACGSSDAGSNAATGSANAATVSASAGTTSSSSSGDMIKVGIINNDPNESGYRTANDKDMKNTFTEANGYEASFAYSLKNDEQITAAQKFIQDGVDYLLLSAADTAGWDSVLKDAQDAGIRVILFDRTIDADESLYEASIVSDMAKEGQTAVDWLKSQNLSEYNIIHLQGVMGSAAQQGNGTAHAGTGEQDRLLEQLLEVPSRVNDRGEVERPERNGAQESGGEQAGVSSSSGGSGETGGSGNLAGNGQGNGSGGPGAGDGSGASQGGGESLEDRSRDASLESYSKIYPQAARASGEEGTAQVGVEISAGGEVLSAWLESSTGYDRLDRAALKSARQWTFSPALDAAGHPVPSRKSVTVVYSLTE